MSQVIKTISLSPCRCAGVNAALLACARFAARRSGCEASAASELIYY